MVSGLVTSPCDQLRIFSGEASEIRMESKSAIRLALSYGEDRYIISPIGLLDERGCSWGRVHPPANNLVSRPRVLYPGFPAAFSSTLRRDTATATRGSGR